MKREEKSSKGFDCKYLSKILVNASANKLRLMSGLRNRNTSQHKYSKSIDYKNGVDQSQRTGSALTKSGTHSKSKNCYLSLGYYNKMSSSYASEYADPIARQDRVAVMRAHAKKYEELSKMKEMQMKYGTKTRAEDVLEANEMLINAIESKLEALDGMNK